MSGKSDTNGREEERKVYRVLVGKREGKRTLLRPKRRGRMKMDLTDIG
jgi:hypothetical protein